MATMRFILRWLVILLAAVFVGATFLALLIATQSPEVRAPAAVLIAMLTFVLLVTWIHFRDAAKRRRAMNVLEQLEQALQLNLPLPRILRSIAETEHATGGNPRFANDVEGVARFLEQGVPLAIALDALPRLPRRLLSLIAAAECMGRLPQVLSRLIRQRRDATMRARILPPFYRTYPFVVCILLIAVMALFAIVVAPKFAKIFRDFAIRLPLMTQLTVNLSEGMGLWIALLALFGCCFMLAMTVAPPAWFFWKGLIEGPGEWLANRLPWIGAIRLHSALADVFELAADATQAGRPVVSALSEAAQLTVNSRLRKDLHRWTDAMSHGQSLHEAARTAAMPRLVSGMLSTAALTPDVTEVFRFLGRYYAMRFSRALTFLQASALPAMALAMGAVVGWLALSLFAPLVELINSIALLSIGL